jgi:diguanylate cyclase (GGDEF)-like protein
VKSPTKVIDSRTIVIPLLVTVVLFLFVGRNVLIAIEDHFYDHMRDLSLNLARGYSYSIQKSLDAEKIMEELIVDKLLLASETTGIYTDIDDYESLVSYAATLRVDEINIYSPQGTMFLTTMGRDITWESFEGHPIYTFINSPERSMIEQIRPNFITGIEYMYGYYKLDNGKIIQIGILAEKIDNLIGSLTPEKALGDILLSNHHIRYACFVMENLDEDCVGMNGDNIIVNTTEISNVIEASGIYGYVSTVDESLYILYLPIEVQGDVVGMLLLHHHLDDQNLALKEVTNLGVSILAIVYALIAYMLILNVSKNKQLSKAAYIDTLTLLPNASYLNKSFNDFLSTGTSKKALIVLNIEEFRTINVAYGYENGDSVLKEITNRISRALDKDSKCFRWEGDRFVILVDNLKHHNEIDQWTNSLLEIFKQPFILNDVKKIIHVKLAVVFLESHQEINEVIQQAMISLQSDYATGHQVIVFDEQIAEAMNRELNIIDELEEIISNKDSQRLYCVFQPIWDFKENLVVGVEALARLNSVYYGAVSPGEFIMIAEKHHMIYDLGKIIFNQAFKFVKQCHEIGYEKIRVAVNVSGIQLLHDQFVFDILTMLEEAQLTGQCLEIEITESILMQDMARINKVLEELRSYGILISIDDFGTGYSSFFTLSELNVDVLKINRSFIRQIYTSMDDQKIIAREIIQMAHKLGLKIVAEEVEYEKEYQYLMKHQCDYIQGYYYCRPLLSYDALHFLKNNQNSNL